MLMAKRSPELCTLRAPDSSFMLAWLTETQNYAFLGSQTFLCVVATQKPKIMHFFFGKRCPKRFKSLECTYCKLVAEVAAKADSFKRCCCTPWAHPSADKPLPTLTSHWRGLSPGKSRHLFLPLDERCLA